MRVSDGGTLTTKMQTEFLESIIKLWMQKVENVKVKTKQLYQDTHESNCNNN